MEPRLKLKWDLTFVRFGGLFTTGITRILISEESQGKAIALVHLLSKFGKRVYGFWVRKLAHDKNWAIMIYLLGQLPSACYSSIHNLF